MELLKFIVENAKDDINLLNLLLMIGCGGLYFQNRILTKTLIENGKETVVILTKVESGFAEMKRWLDFLVGKATK